jgi:hypothetical protein
MSQSVSTAESLYTIPKKFRVAENLHIIFWLLKDLGWAMLWKPVGLAMFVPTLILSIVITKQTSAIKSEFYHNMAVTSWICANGYWMITDFFWPKDASLRYFAAIPFGVGILFIIIYYAFFFTRERAAKAQ